jgi:ABC-type uncharacterized transport system permease subunit
MNNTILYAFAVPLLSASGGLAALNICGKWTAPEALRRVLVAFALFVSGLLLCNVLFQADGMHFGFVIGLMCVAWLASWVAFVEGFFNRVLLLELIVFPLCAVVFMLPLWVDVNSVVQMAGDRLFQLHLLIALAAYSLLGIAATHGIVMAFQEKVLHKPVAISRENRLLRERILDQLPSLLTMESILFRQLWAGFVLLSLTLITGFLFSEEWLGTSWHFDHKTLFAIVSWCSFAVLLGGRLVFGWRGKLALRWCVVSYAVLVLAYFGTQFVLEFVLIRAN